MEPACWDGSSSPGLKGTSWTLRPRNGDVLNDIAMFMEVLAPFFPAWFTMIVCTSGIFKSVVGVAGGATRAALTVHQARRDNMADISAKDGSQETLVNLAGLLVSLILIPLVTDNPVLTLSLFCVFTALHLFANYKAVRSVVMETLNEARLAIVLQHFLQDGRILSPAEANRKEPVLLEFRKTVPIKLGVRLQEVVQSPEELSLAFKKNNNTPFLLAVTNGCVCVCLGAQACTQDEIRAMCQAIWISDELTACTELPEKHPDLVHESHKLMDAVFSQFVQGVEAAGWDVKRTLLDWDEWRLELKTKSS
ncbi:RUS1 family protein C16orf58 homolog [Dunckerocampus dactyliophorus]|uniref:RUS1 family protein C16orf58 homolog n=1 Tax=Dunckerocampus dactyliophorus TaxID=161453 RepID=UPI0024054A2D|nr:RUS1 family protein C16orf58 homolog [Dunckerocampus dactyliophorus]